MKILLMVTVLSLAVNSFAAEPTVSKTESLVLTKAAVLDKTSTKQAIDLLEHKLGPQSSAALDYALAVYLLKIDKLKLAQKSLQTTLTKAPSFSRARFALVRIYISNFDYVSAIKHLNLLLDQDKNNRVKCWRLMGYCHQNMNNYAAAEQAFRFVIARDPNNVTANQGLVQALMSQQKLKDAKSIVVKLITLDPVKAEYWNLLASIALDAGDSQDALIQLLTAEQLGIADETIKVNIASLFFQKGLYQLSAHRYLKLNQHDKLNPAKSLEATRSFLSVGNYEVAQKLLSSHHKYSQDQVVLQSYLNCQLLIGQGKIKKATEALKLYLEKNPIHVEALTVYASLLRKEGNISESVLMLKRAERLEPSNIAIYLGLAQCFIDKEEYIKAEQILQSALDQKEDFSIRKFKANLHQFIQSNRLGN